MTFETLLADNDVPQQKTRIIRVVNMLSISTAITVFVLGPYLYSITGHLSILYPALIEGTLFMMVPMFNNYGKHKAALRLMFAVHTASVAYFTLILGPSSNVVAFSVFLCVSAMTIFSNRTALSIAIFIVLITAAGVKASHLYNIIPILPLDGMALQNLDRTVDISVLILTLSIFYSHASETRLNEKEKELLRNKLDSANKALDHANQSKSVYVRNTTHELRAPMNIILGLVQEYEIKKDYQSQTVTLTLNDFDALYAQSMRTLQIVNNTLVWARIEAGEQEELNKTRFNIRDFLLNQVHANKRLAPKHKNIKLYSDAGDLPPYILTDESKLMRVLSNLLSNAFKFTKKDTSVIIKGYVEDQKMVFTVEDRGPGIPYNMLEKIFEPFYTDNKQKTESTGVGLPIAREMTRILGGILSVKSDGRTGSTFKVVLPLEIPETLEVETDEHNESTFNLKGKNVLVIDDDSMSYTITQKHLVRLGANTSYIDDCDSGDGIVEILMAIPTDLILLDLHMPKISGKEVLQKILSNPATSRIPVVIMSGDAFTDVGDELMELGASGFIKKPVIVKELYKTISSILIPNHEVPA